MSNRTPWWIAVQQWLQAVDNLRTKAEDRIDYLACIDASTRSLSASLRYWRAWMLDYQKVKLYDMTDLKEVEQTIYDITKTLLELDSKFTKKYDKLVQEQTNQQLLESQKLAEEILSGEDKDQPKSSYID